MSSISLDVFRYFFLQASLAVTLPYILNPTVGRDQHEMRNPLYPITTPKSGISVYKFVPLVSGQLLFGNKLLPLRLGIEADIHNCNPIFAAFRNLFQFGNRLQTRPTAFAPELKQDVFPQKFRQMMHVTVDVIKIAVRHPVPDADRRHRIEAGPVGD